MPLYFTTEGLERLRSKIRTEEARKIQTGREVGEAAGDNCDWHDNAPFEDARSRLELQAANIRRLQESLHEAVITVVYEQNEKVAIGTTIVIVLDDEQEKTYTIGAAEELWPDEGLITYESPLAKALLGKKVGDTVEVKIRDKEVLVEIKVIFPPSYRYREIVRKFYDRTKVDSGT